VDQLTRREGLESLKQGGYQQPERLHPVRRDDEDDDGNWETAEVLLVFQALVGGQQRVELGGGLPKERTVAKAGPARLRYGVNVVAGRSVSGLGRDSSSRSRTRSQQVLGDFQRRHGLFSRDGWKVVEEPFQAVASGEVVQQILDRDARTRKDRRAPEHLRVASHDGFKRWHFRSGP